MKKWILLLIALVLWGEYPAAAQSGPGKLKKAGQTLLNLPREAVRKSQAVSPLVRMSAPAGAALPAVEKTSSVPRTLSLQVKKIADGYRRAAYASTGRSGQTAVVWQSVFRAEPPSSYFRTAFSGTVFKVIYQGQEEIYGVIAAHALAEAPHTFLTHVYANAFLHKHFEAKMYREDGSVIPLEGEVVQLGAPGGVDIALVKLAPVQTDQLHPLVLSTHEPEPGEILHSEGYAKGRAVYMPQRQVLERAELSLRTTLPCGNPKKRIGLCGGPVLNLQNELVGIHTGSVSTPTAEESDKGFATHAKFVRLLVAAYHNGGNGFWPFELAGQHLTDLRIDEFISRFILSDAQEQPLWAEQVDTKFSYSKANRLIAQLAPRYVELYIGRVGWGERAPEFMEKHPRVRRVKYDLQTRRVVLAEDLLP